MGLREVRAFLARHELRPHRDLGQNFLVDDALAARLAVLAGVEADDAVIEVGTGLGVLTRALCARAGRVVTLEVDRGIVRALRQDDALPANAELRHVDAREVDFAELARSLGGPVRLVANLPYSVGTPLLRALLDARDALVDWSVMIQREVANRLAAETGTKDYGSLAVLHRLCTDPSVALVLKPGCFHPAPKVASSFVRIAPHARAGLGEGELAVVEGLVRRAFNQRRKTLANALRGLPEAQLGRLPAALAEQGIDPQTRAERVAPEAWLALARALGPPGASG